MAMEMEMETMVDTMRNSHISRLTEDSDDSDSEMAPYWEDVVDERFTKEIEERKVVIASAAGDPAYQQALRDFYDWVPLGMRLSDDSVMDPSLEYDGEDDDSVTLAKVDKQTLDDARKRNEEPDDLFLRQSEKLRVESHKFALAALSYLRERGHDLELVKTCLYVGVGIPDAVRMHFNFKAKRADDPHAPVETYFAQLLDYGNSKYVVDCCVSLGKSSSLPYDRDTKGCSMCPKYVHHPERNCEGVTW